MDSTVTMTPTSIDTTPASAGRTFDPAGAVDAAVEAVGALDAPPEVVVEAPAVDIPPAHGDVEALVAKAAAERMVGDIVVTSGKDRWTIKAVTVRTWLRLESGADGLPWPVADTDAIAASLGQGRQGGQGRAGLRHLHQGSRWQSDRRPGVEGRAAARRAGDDHRHRRGPREPGRRPAGGAGPGAAGQAGARH